MLKPDEKTLELMGQKVKYCRMGTNEQGLPELQHKDGVIVGIIVGATKRVQVMVKPEGNDTTSAYTLDFNCINPTDAEIAAYEEHHKKLKALVDEHNAAQKQREADKIKEVDEMNYGFFGKPINV